MVTNLRSAAGMATIWAVAIAGVSATAWFAIDRAGRDITNASVSTLVATPPLTTPTAAEPTDTEPAPPPASTPAPSVAAPPRATPATPTPTATPRRRETRRRSATPATPTPTPNPQTPQVRSVTVRGGQVTVRCMGTGIRLQVAQPENEWRVHVDTQSVRIVVTFRTGDEEEGTRQTEVAAVCSRGIPVFDISNR
jgi:hypothetical protein